MSQRHLRRRTLVFALPALVAACSAAHVAETSSAPGILVEPRPARVLVYDFVTDWQSVSLDSGLAARIERETGGTSVARQQQAIAAEVQKTISDALVRDIEAMGLRAARATEATPVGRNDLLLRGRITRVSAGNQTRQRLIGFGAGQSEIDASAALFAAPSGQPPVLLERYAAASTSGRTPGLGLGAASAAAGHVGAAIAGTAAGATSRARSGLSAEAKRLASRLAHNLGQFFHAEGWIPAPAVPG
ncbi:MAG: DUF4410 domain-containing protein [Acetobacteraceae bacterium]